MRLIIEEGCLPCFACVHAVPEVFVIPDDGDEALVSAMARVDAREGHNRDTLSPLTDAALTRLEDIREAIAGCPVEVIKLIA
jgi:ferredoxin